MQKLEAKMKFEASGSAKGSYMEDKITRMMSPLSEQQFHALAITGICSMPVYVRPHKRGVFAERVLAPRFILSLIPVIQEPVKVGLQPLVRTGNGKRFAARKGESRKAGRLVSLGSMEMG